MPTKAAQLIAFLSVFLVSAGLHRFVYVNLKRVILRDYPRLGPRLARYAAALFVVMDTPFVFLFYRNRIRVDVNLLTQLIIYPFSIWQAIMLMWVMILLPFMVWRRGVKRFAKKLVSAVRRPAENSDPEPAFEGVSE